MSTKIDYNCSLCIAIFIRILFLIPRFASDKRRREKSNRIDSKISTIFSSSFPKHFFFPRFLFFWMFFFIFLFYFGVSRVRCERERNTRKKQQAHSKLYVSLLVGAPVYTTITTKKGEKKEFPDFIIIFQHLYFYVENFFCYIFYLHSTYNNSKGTRLCASIKTHHNCNCR